MPDSTNPAPDAVALAFREMAAEDPLELHCASDGTPYCLSCGEDEPGHTPDCPWLRRKQKREALKKAWEGRDALVESILDGDFYRNLGLPLPCSGVRLRDALAALKGAHTK